MSRVDAVYPLAIGLAEGGWVAVVYLLVDAVARVESGAPPDRVRSSRPAGAAWGRADRPAVVVPADDRRRPARRWGHRRARPRRPSPACARRRGARVGALADDPGAVLVGLAALRGFVRAGALRDAAQAARPFFVGLVGLACAWIFGGALSEPMRTAFRDAAVVPTLAFVAGSLAATGLARTRLRAADADFDPRTNRPWLVALLGVAAALGLASAAGRSGHGARDGRGHRLAADPAARDRRGLRGPDPRPVAGGVPAPGGRVHVRAAHHPRRPGRDRRPPPAQRGRPDPTEGGATGSQGPDPVLAGLRDRADAGRARPDRRRPRVPRPGLAAERGCRRGDGRASIGASTSSARG